MEQLEQSFKYPDNYKHTDYGNTQHNRKIPNRLEHLKHSTLPLPLSASGRNWNGTETIWPTTMMMK